MQVERVARQIAGKYRFQQSRMSEVQEESGESEESWKIDERMAAQEFEELFVKVMTGRLCTAEGMLTSSRLPRS